MASYKKTITLGLDYSQFEGGITKCNSAMRTLDAEFKHASSQMELTGSKSEKLGLKQEYLTQKINLQAKKVEEAKKKYNALMDAHADTSKIEAADRALLKERTTLQNLENDLTQTTIAESGLKENAMALGAVLATVGAGLFKCATDAAEYADNMLTLSNNTGVATDELQKLEYASDLVDVSMESMTGAMSRIAKNAKTASDSSTELGQAYAQLGIKVKDAGGEFRSTDDIFYDAIDALGKIENQTERDNLAMTLFGKSAQDLAGVINAGSEGLKEYGDEAERLGLVMSEDDLKKAGEFQDAIDKLGSSFDALKNSLGLSVIPILTGLFEALSNIPVPVLRAVTVVVGLVAIIATLAKTINSTVQAASGISKMFSAVGDAVDPAKAKVIGITAAVIALVAAITALVVAIAVLRGKGKELNSSLGQINDNITSASTQVRSAGHMATGTQYWRGGPTWVGEHGPEIVDLPRGTKIYNNKESEGMGNRTYNINMNCDLASMRSLGDVIDAVTGIEDSVSMGVV